MPAAASEIDVASLGAAQAQDGALLCRGDIEGPAVLKKVAAARN